MVEGVVYFAIGDEHARAALGDDPDLANDDVPLASTIVCRAPPWSNASSYYLAESEQRYVYERASERCAAADDDNKHAPRQFCDVDEPKSVCLRVTLNDDPHAHSGEGGDDCVRYTYYDE